MERGAFSLKRSRLTHRKRVIFKILEELDHGKGAISYSRLRLLTLAHECLDNDQSTQLEKWTSPSWHKSFQRTVQGMYPYVHRYYVRDTKLCPIGLAADDALFRTKSKLPLIDFLFQSDAVAAFKTETLPPTRTRSHPTVRLKFHYFSHRNDDGSYRTLHGTGFVSTGQRVLIISKLPLSPQLFYDACEVNYRIALLKFHTYYDNLIHGWNDVKATHRNWPEGIPATASLLLDTPTSKRYPLRGIKTEAVRENWDPKNALQIEELAESV